MSGRTAVLLADLRIELRKILIEKIQCPRMDLTDGEEQSAAATPSMSSMLPASLQEEGAESRSEWRRTRMGPASSLLPQPAADPTTGLAHSYAPGMAAIKAAPD